jgi:hypothetical protein
MTKKYKFHPDHFFGVVTLMSDELTGLQSFPLQPIDGPQEAAGGFIKRQADIAVLRGNAIIQNAKDLFCTSVRRTG